MNKQRMILAVIGGVMGLTILAVAYFDWSAYSARNAAIEGDDEEGTDGLETVVAKAEQLSRKEVYPCAESVKALEANAAAVTEWKNEAAKLASRGDRPVKVTTPAQFKTDIVADAKRLMQLPGSVGGVIAKKDFAFGPFKEYIAEGKMPADADLKRLTRQWDDVMTVVEILAQCGIAELVDVQFKEAEAAPTEEAQASKPKNNKKKSTKAAKTKKFDADKVAYTYVFTFAAKPAALVKTVNALETCERFVTVEDFGFKRPTDAIATALGGGEKKEQTQSTGRRRRRGMQAQVEEKKDEALKNGIVTDPTLDAPLNVTMTITVSDFGTMEEKPAADKE